MPSTSTPTGTSATLNTRAAGYPTPYAETITNQNKRQQIWTQRNNVITSTQP